MGFSKEILSTEAVTTIPPQCFVAHRAAAISIQYINLPPIRLPNTLVSFGSTSSVIMILESPGDFVMSNFLVFIFYFFLTQIPFHNPPETPHQYPHRCPAFQGVRENIPDTARRLSRDRFYARAGRYPYHRKEYYPASSQNGQRLSAPAGFPAFRPSCTEFR